MQNTVLILCILVHQLEHSQYKPLLKVWLYMVTENGEMHGSWKCDSVPNSIPSNTSQREHNPDRPEAQSITVFTTYHQNYLKIKIRWDIQPSFRCLIFISLIVCGYHCYLDRFSYLTIDMIGSSLKNCFWKIISWYKTARFHSINILSPGKTAWLNKVSYIEKWH